MGHELNLTGRPIVYSCSWPAYMIDHPEMVDYDVIGRYCNLWRNFDDIRRSWSSIKSIIDYYDHHQDKHIPAQGPGKWHDPDMIIVGNTEISVDQSKVQMSIWSIWSAPLIMSNDLRLIAPAYRNILLNRHVIAVDQDPLGIMGRLVANVFHFFEKFEDTILFKFT
uniref:Alpha-galactosidase n=1 Tax=Ascaris lumbricoides TaxID=6252 RepID=A0A0M3IVD0_ASCLU